VLAAAVWSWGLSAAIAAQDAQRFDQHGIFEAQIDELPGACAAAYSDDGALAVLCPDSGQIVLLEQSAVTKRVAIPADTGVNPGRPTGAMAFLGDGRWAVGGADGLVVMTSDEPPRMQRVAGIDHVAALSAGADDTLGIAMATDRGSRVVIVDVTSGEVEREIDIESGRPGRASGIAIDPDGAIYVADEWMCTVTKYDGAGQRIWSFGEFGGHVGFLSAPGGLIWDSGRLYVADTRNQRIDVLDAETGALVDQWGTHSIRPREGASKLHYPSALAMSASGDQLAVCEPWEDRVQVFRRARSAEEQPERVKYADLGEYTHFGDFIASDSRLIAVLQPDSHRVIMYDIGASHEERPEPVLIGAYGEYGVRPGQFIDPGPVAMDAARKRVYVADQGNRRLCALSLEWTEGERLRFNPTLLTFARSVDLVAVSGMLGLAHVVHLTAMAKVPDETGDILIADGANGALWRVDSRLKRFDRIEVTLGDGAAFIPRAVGAQAGDDRSARLAVATLDGAVYAGELRGTTAQLTALDIDGLIDPAGVAIMDSGVVVVSDRVAHALRIAGNLDGNDSVGASETLVSKGLGIGLGELFKPRACVVTPDGRLFVVDRGNHRLVEWSGDLRCIGVFGARLFTMDAQRALREGQ
jgi:sugar lactone lactonase YvrE